MAAFLALGRHRLRLRARQVEATGRLVPTHAYNVPKGGRGPIFGAEHAPRIVPGPDSESGNFRKLNGPGFTKRTPFSKLNTGLCSFMLCK